MELGKYLVKELGFQNGNDILPKWMAHHLAELLHEAENSKTSSERIRARREAVDLIVELWAKREHLPGDVYPLAQYKDIVTVLDLIRIDGNPWRFNRSDSKEIDRTIADLYDAFARLMIAFIFYRSELATYKKISPIAFEKLTEAEKRTVLGIQYIITEGIKNSKKAKGRSYKEEKSTLENELPKWIAAIIDRMQEATLKLKDQFKMKDTDGVVEESEEVH